jgi:MFS family permease
MNISLASFGGFLPVLLKSFGYSALKTQLYTIPIYTVVAASILVIGFLSDRFKKRGLFLILCYSIAGLGWLLLLVSKSLHLSFAACFLIGLGTYPQVVLIQTWMNSNVLGFTKRCVRMF